MVEEEAEGATGGADGGGTLAGATTGAVSAAIGDGLEMSFAGVGSTSGARLACAITPSVPRASAATITPPTTPLVRLAPTD